MRGAGRVLAVLVAICAVLLLTTWAPAPPAAEATPPPEPTTYDDFLLSLSPFELSHVYEGKMEEIASLKGKIKELEAIMARAAEIQRQKYADMGIFY